MFYGWTDQPSRVGQLGVFFFVFFLIFTGSKNDPKNPKISKKNQTFFSEKFWENISTYFQKYSTKIFKILVKKWLISQNGQFASVAPVKHFFFFCLKLQCNFKPAKQMFYTKKYGALHNL